MDTKDEIRYIVVDWHIYREFLKMAPFLACLVLVAFGPSIQPGDFESQSFEVPVPSFETIDPDVSASELLEGTSYLNRDRIRAAIMMDLIPSVWRLRQLKEKMRPDHPIIRSIEEDIRLYMEWLESLDH